jgi:hypothetical protein
VVATNVFPTDTPREIELVRQRALAPGAQRIDLDKQGRIVGMF